VKFKPTLRDQLRASQQSMRNLAAMTEGIYENRAPPEKPIPPKREQADRRDLEGPVRNAIRDLLQSHPRVALAVRMNSGMAYSDGGAPVWFNIFVKPKSGMRMPDFIFVMKNGLFGAIEAKEPLWKGPRTKHEREQDEFLLAVRQAGGVAGFASSVDMALRILNGE
jgi:hypothetical protein